MSIQNTRSIPELSPYDTQIRANAITAAFEVLAIPRQGSVRLNALETICEALEWGCADPEMLEVVVEWYARATVDEKRWACRWSVVENLHSAWLDADARQITLTARGTTKPTSHAQNVSKRGQMG